MDDTESRGQEAVAARVGDLDLSLAPKTTDQAAPVIEDGGDDPFLNQLASAALAGGALSLAVYEKALQKPVLGGTLDESRTAPLVERLARWYSSISFERADLMSQLGGNSGSFILNVDTVILRFALDESFQQGFIGNSSEAQYQFLHLLYAFEHFLHQLQSCDGNVRLVFFDAMRPLLDRLGDHLWTFRQCCLLICAERQRIDFVRFDSWYSPEFHTFVGDWQPAFLLMDDLQDLPAVQEITVAQAPSELENSQNLASLPLALMLHAICLQLHVSVMFDIERVGRKMQSFIVVPGAFAVSSLDLLAAGKLKECFKDYGNDEVAVDFEQIWKDVANKYLESTRSIAGAPLPEAPQHIGFREVITALAIKNGTALEEGTTLESLDADGVEELNIMCTIGRLLLLTGFMCRKLSLKERCIRQVTNLDAWEQAEDICVRADFFVSELSPVLTAAISGAADRAESLRRIDQVEGSKVRSTAAFADVESDLTDLSNGDKFMNKMTDIFQSFSADLADLVDKRFLTTIVVLICQYADERSLDSVNNLFFNVPPAVLLELDAVVGIFDPAHPHLFPLDLSWCDFSGLKEVRLAAASDPGVPQKVDVKNSFLEKLLGGEVAMTFYSSITGPQPEAPFWNEEGRFWYRDMLLDVAENVLKQHGEAARGDMLADDSRLERYTGAAREKARKRMIMRAKQKGAFRIHKLAASFAALNSHHHPVHVAKKGTHQWENIPGAVPGAPLLHGGVFVGDAGDIGALLIAGNAQGPGNRDISTAASAKATKGALKDSNDNSKDKAGVKSGGKTKKISGKAADIIKKNEEARKEKLRKLDHDRLPGVLAQLAALTHRAMSPGTLLAKAREVIEGLSRVNEELVTFVEVTKLLKLPETQLRAVIQGMDTLVQGLIRNFRPGTDTDGDLHNCICYTFQYIHVVFAEFGSVLTIPDVQKLQTALIALGFPKSARCAYIKWSESPHGRAVLETEAGISKKKADSKANAKKKSGGGSKKDFLSIGLVEPATVTRAAFACVEGLEHEVQLKFMGHTMRRSLNSKPDPRVKFEPDAWQVRLMDTIDQYRSALVCAPTGSGKTFLCFYAMERVLAYDDSSVVVYVCPSKALLEQVSIETQARFRNKEYPYASDMRLLTQLQKDHSDADGVTNAQICLTVPDSFEMLLMSSCHRDWVGRLKYVIFDEIHCIGGSEEGRAWERLIQLIPCPFLALSATVGNPTSFHRWLSQAHMSAALPAPPNGRDAVEIIHFHERYADLSNCIYSADFDLDTSEIPSLMPQKVLSMLTNTNGAAEDMERSTVASTSNATPGKPGVVKVEGGLFALNVFACTQYKQILQTGFTGAFYAPSADLNRVYTVLSMLLRRKWYDAKGIKPKENLGLHQREELQNFLEYLTPSVFMDETPCITKRQYRYYLDAVKYHIRELMLDGLIDEPMYEEFVFMLTAGPALSKTGKLVGGYVWDPQLEVKSIQESISVAQNPTTGAIDTGLNLALMMSQTPADSHRVLNNVVRFVRSLDSLNMLPALIFNFDNDVVTAFGLGLAFALAQLQHDKYYGTPQAAERTRKLNRKNQDEYKAYLAYRAKLEKMRSLSKSEKEEQGLSNDTIEAELSAPPQPPPKDVAEEFDPEFNFSDRKIWGKQHDKITEIIEDATSRWKDKKIALALTAALERGIGVHHASMPRRYRNAVETLFRLGFIRVVFSTETLSIGVNMPARSTCFIGDSVVLTPLVYQQTSGRAGRRGHDTYGHVVFWDVSPAKMRRLICAPLPTLSGEFPLTPTLVLRTYQLLTSVRENHIAAIRKTLKASMAEQKVVALRCRQEMRVLESSLGRLYRCPLYLVKSGTMTSFDAEEERRVLSAIKLGFCSAVMHLQKCNMLDAKGDPIGLAGLATVMHHHEPHNLLLVELISKRTLHKLLENPDLAQPLPVADDEIIKLNKDLRFPPAMLRALLNVLALLLEPKRLPYNLVMKMRFNPNSPSPLLPPLPEEVEAAFRDRWDKAMEVALDYVSASTEHGNDPKDLLTPITQLSFDAKTKLYSTGDISPIDNQISDLKFVSRTRSPFAAISGKPDRLMKAVDEIAIDAPLSVHFEASMVPSFNYKKHSDGSPLVSNFLVDFFNYGSLQHASEVAFVERKVIWYPLFDAINALEKVFLSYAEKSLAVSAANGSIGRDPLVEAISDIADHLIIHKDREAVSNVSK